MKAKMLECECKQHELIKASLAQTQAKLNTTELDSIV